MKLVKIAAASLNQVPMDWNGNMSRIREAVQRAYEANCDFLLTPEMSITGYGCEDMFLSPDVQSKAMEQLYFLASELPRGITVIVGLPVLHRNALFNCAAVIRRNPATDSGEVIGFVAKQNLAGDGLHYEPRWFDPWPVGVQDVTDDGIKIGDYSFHVPYLGDKTKTGIRFGFEVCEDAWVAQRPGGRLVKRGVDIIFNPSASHFAFGKFAVRKGFVVEGSRAMGCTYVYANLLGNEAGRAIYDGGNLIASGGTLVAQGPRLTFNEVEMTMATVDVALTRTQQSRTHSFHPTLGEQPDCIEFLGDRRSSVDLTFDLATQAVPAWESSLDLKREEFQRAVALGLFDYMRKSRSAGYVVSLSGGADSAACCELIRYMVERGIEDLGRDRFVDKLGLRFDPLGDRPVSAIVHGLLTTAYQGTRNSGDVTRSAAQAVADGVGSEHHVLDVDAMVEGYKTMLAGALGRPLTWEKDDIALQNIQARVRAPSIWMFANVQNRLLISTSNRSEAAVGYATMDGDTAGGIAPIAGIDKAFLRGWLRWREEQGSAYLKPVNNQQPTAELRPADKGQTDEDDLMPYPVLDAIEKAAIRDKRGPAVCLEVLGTLFPDYDRTTLKSWVVRFFTLWSRNQWKRERYAPSFHLDDENLDPKTWCRFPILNSGFANELALLRERF